MAWRQPATSTDGKFGVRWEPELTEAFVQLQLARVKSDCKKISARFKDIGTFQSEILIPGILEDLDMCAEIVRCVEPLTRNDPVLKQEWSEAQLTLTVTRNNFYLTRVGKNTVRQLSKNAVPPNPHSPARQSATSSAASSRARASENAAITRPRSSAL